MNDDITDVPNNTVYIIKGVCNNKESVVNAVNELLRENIKFKVKFVDENYNDIMSSIIVDSNRNTIGDVDIVADIVDKFNRMWLINNGRGLRKWNKFMNNEKFNWRTNIILPTESGEYLILLKKPFMGFSDSMIAYFQPNGIGVPRFIVSVDRGNVIYIPVDLIASWAYVK